MVRFIIEVADGKLTLTAKIYIPIWLDLLYYRNIHELREMKNLHSNMVRFIIISYRHVDSQNFKIYIPIWLDLL